MTLTLEPGLTPLPDGHQWLLGGLDLASLGLGVIEDDLNGREVEQDDVDYAVGDGSTPGFQRIPAGTYTIKVEMISPPGDSTARAAAMRDIERELELVLNPLPDRTCSTVDNGGLRLLRWRRAGGPAQRLWYRPAHGKAIDIQSDKQRLQFDNGDAVLRIECPDPVKTSDGYELVHFDAGETKTVTNDGTLTAVYPLAWSFFASATAGLQHVDHPEEQILCIAPAGENVSCPRNLEIVTDTTAGVAYGQNWGPAMQPPLLRPGPNPLKAIAGALDLKVWSTW